MRQKQTGGPALAFAIDRNAKEPVFEQICAALRDRIVSKSLPEGCQLPATRGFAVDLGVSRSTVVTAYEQLVAEGYLNSRQGAGYRVCAIGEVELPPAARIEKMSAVPAAPSVQKPPESRRLRPFETGQPDMRLFPHKQWARTVARICRTRPRDLLEGANPIGHHALRQAIADHVFDWRGLRATPEQIIVTAGATDALDICMQALLRRGDPVGVEDPGYPPIRRFAERHGLPVVSLRIDGAGAEVPGDETFAKAVVLTPSHQHPLGGAMSAGRRREFIQWAAREDAWVIEDDYDSEFRFSGRPIPAMAGMDDLQRTVYVGSFSKIFSNSLRLGYAVAPLSVVADLQACLRGSAPRASWMPQAPLSDFMESGEFYRHLRRMRRIYGERHRHLQEALAREFSAFGSATDHHAGMQIVFHLREGLNDQAIVKAATENGLGCEALSSYAVAAKEVSGLVLGCCHMTLPEIDAGLATLQKTLQGIA